MRFFHQSFVVLAFLPLILSSSQHAKSRGSKTVDSSRGPCDGIPTIPTNRRACGLYIWDAPSALFYKWCNHLLKDYLYEGMGGHMFVRYESNSILQLLYPCTRYSPNRCLVCGGSYPDHLELWWSKRLYTPFDRHLDKTYESALKIPPPSPRTRAVRGRANTKLPLVTGPPTYSFHKRYVEDVSDIIQSESDGKKQLEMVKKKYARARKEIAGWTMRTLPKFRIGYILPPMLENNEDGHGTSFLQVYIRGMVLGAFNNFIYLQETENAKLVNHN